MALTKTILENRVRTFAEARDALYIAYKKSGDKDLLNAHSWLSGMIRISKSGKNESPGWVEKGITWALNSKGPDKYSPNDKMPPQVKTKIYQLLLRKTADSPITAKAIEGAVKVAGTEKPTAGGILDIIGTTGKWIGGLLILGGVIYLVGPAIRSGSKAAAARMNN